MKYILNSAVITAPGTYEYKRITSVEAQLWLQAGGWKSCIGYAETAEALSRIAGISVPVSRKVITMRAEDEALVFGLIIQQGYNRYDPAQKGCMGLGFILTQGLGFILTHCEIGMLRRCR